MDAPNPLLPGEATDPILGLAIIAFYVSLIVLPVWRILNRLGLRGAWSLVALIPLVNIGLLWLLAVMRWPIEQAQGVAAYQIRAKTGGGR